MAESCGELEALAASREDLFDLALKLADAGLKASPAQIVDAHNLLLGLRLTGQLPPERSDWLPFLAPIFCRSAAHQETFYRVFPSWASEHPSASGKADSAGVGKGSASQGSRLRRRRLFPGLATLLCAWLAILALLPPPEPPVVVSQPAAEEQPKVPSKPAKPQTTTENRTETLPTRFPEDVPPQTAFGWTGADLRNAAAAAPVLAWLIWLLWSFIDRRLALTREPGESPSKPHARWVRGANAALFDPADLRYAAGRFRDLVSRPTRRIDARRTVAATVRKAGFFSPVYRNRRHHPEYLVLVDRATPPQPGAHPAAPATARDHLAAYGEALMEEFRAEQVITHVYHFDRDPRRCRLAGSHEAALDLAALEARHGDCRLIILADAAGLFEPLGGRPVGWLGDFEPWPQRIVLTPKPVGEWGFAEATLALEGFAVAPAHPKSLALLARLWLPAVLLTDLSEQALQQVRLLAPVEANAPELPRSIQRYGDRWLDSEPPGAGGIRRLLDELKAYLGGEGFLLLQALAVYPELAWPLSLYVDWKLFGQSAPGSRVARLLSLSRLPWLRHGRIPDYLRVALIRSLPRRKHGEVVEFYRTLLATLDRQGPHAIALDISPPPEKRFLRKLKAWLQGDDRVYGDRIFARVLLGGRPGWLDVELPQMLSRVLPGTAWDGASTRVLAGLLTVGLLGGGAHAAMGHFAARIDAWLREDELARHSRVQVRVIGSPQAAWLTPPLLAALARGGFDATTREPPMAPGKTDESVLRPAQAWGGAIVAQVGEQAQAAGAWVAQRLRYLDYGRVVEIHRGALDVVSDPRGAGAAGVRSEPVDPKQIVVWLADRPRIFQDSLSAAEPEMVEIPAGEFAMGSPPGEQGRSEDEGPQHPVRIAKPFALGRYEVTFDEYDAFAKATGRELPDDQGWGRGRRPVINVSWNDAQAYADWLSKQTGKAYRLPTEAEWEYAARAGTPTARYWGDDRKGQQACAYANVYDRRNAAEIKKRYSWSGETFNCDDPFPFTAPVGQFKPNDWGLQDMLGNVWEWVADCWHDSYQGAPPDGAAWESKDCGQRVVRGGSWGADPVYVRSAGRSWGDPDDRDGGSGFRLARTL